MKRGEVTLQGVMIAILTVGLFFGLISAFVMYAGYNYDTTGYDEAKIQKYLVVMDNLSLTVSQIHGEVDQTTIDKGAFDFFADIFNKVLSPFKFTYRSFKLLGTLTSDSVDDLQLLPIVKDYLITMITILVIIGIVMIKYFLGRTK